MNEGLCRFSRAMQKTFAVEEGGTFSFRRCLWLCLPALILGAVLRIALLSAIPEALYGSDSNSYFETASDLYLKGDFDLPAKRRYIYPLLLVAAPLVPFCNSLQIVAVVQHAAGLAMLVGIGWITGHLVRRPGLWVPLVTTLSAVWPRMLYYEHEMVAESLLLGVFIAAVAIAAPPGGLATRRRLIAFCFMALLIMAVKPAGRPLWLGLLGAAVLITRRPLAWPKICYATVPLAVVIALTTGGDAQGPWLFLSSTLPLVKAEGEPYAKERALLRTAIETARADLPNYAFRQAIYKKMLSNTRPDAELGPDYTALAKDKARFSKVANTLGRAALLDHPVQYFRLVVMKVIASAANRHPEERLFPARFWEDQNHASEGRWARRPAEMRLVYEMEEPAYLAMVAERTQRQLWLSPVLHSLRQQINWLRAGPGRPGEPPVIHLQTLGWLTLLGLAAALLPGRFARTSILWLPVLLYLVIVYAVGDSLPRYLHPIEWALFILIAIGLDAVVERGCALVRRFRAEPPAASTGFLAR